MTRTQVAEVIKEIYPKVEQHYGHSKFQECSPYVEIHHNIYARYSGEVGAQGEQDDCHAEYDRIDNSIIIYYPNMQNKKHIIETLIHEYQHYLQSPSWMSRYYKMGYDYSNHPYEKAATLEELNWNKI
tara:strand:+ start:1422 stop:1805 length:384 start_codon:yes stop_codon:yes gene_type:complete